ncbi:hypothetical protein [Mucilaginibacter sp.]|uniref:hypothetical protein n=1 Tax=Mucilaginibacter sp. TaxID=1882438 RepID=UPI0035BC633D
MSTAIFNTKEEIRGRMLGNAVDYWGLTNVNDMDPLVKLLVEALSTELFNVSNDVKNLENRVLNKISRILASDYLTSALPAHAILKGQPIETREKLTVKNQFFYRQPVSANAAKQGGENTDMFFSPAGDVNLYNAEIRYTSNGLHLYEYNEHQHKNVLLNTRPDAYPEPNILWVGIDCAPQLNSLKDLAIFTEWPSYSANDEFYKLLSVVKCFMDGKELETVPGLTYEEELNVNNRPVFYEQNIINLITRDIKQYYQDRFITLTDAALTDISSHKQAFPDEFTHLFNAGELNRLKTCVWIKLTFPAAISPQIIDELQISVNCFPVINRRLHEQKYRLNDLNYIIPIKPALNNHFLSVNNLHDDKNVNYTEIPYTQAGKSQDGSYSIRNGGAERFDDRSAQQLITYLFELLRDEKAAFASYGNDFLNSVLKTLEQNLALIERKSNAVKDGGQQFNYLIVKPVDKAAMLYLQYWTTLADKANNLRRGVRLQQFEMLKIKAESLRLMTSSIGGRNNLGASERIQAYKYGLTTKDRIVTQADLVSFCHFELGNKITDVKISKGVAVSSNPKEGFKKTIDIYVKPAVAVRLSESEWDTLLSLLLSKLENRSVINSNYRIYLNN